MRFRIACTVALGLTLIVPAIGCSGTATIGLGTIETPSHLPYLENNRLAAVVITFHFKTPSGEPANVALSGFAVDATHVITSSEKLREIGTLDKILVHPYNAKDGKVLPSVEIVSQVTNDRFGLLMLETKTAMPGWVIFPKKPQARSGSMIYSIDFVSYNDVYPGQVHVGNVSAVYRPQKNFRIVFVDIPVNRGSPGCPVFNGKGELVGMLAGLIKTPGSEDFDQKRGVITPASNVMEFLSANKVAFQRAK